MNNPMCHTCRLSVLAIVFGQAFPVLGQEIDAERREAIAALAETQNELRMGAGYLSDPTRRGGMFTGMREEGGYLLADIELHRLDQATGTRFRLSGRDLGLDTREISVDHHRQGHWRYGFAYSQTQRHDAMVVNTRLSGIGSESLAIKGESSARAVDFSQKRDLFSLGAEYFLSKADSLRVRFTHEDKVGERLFGRGAFGGSTSVPNPTFGCSNPLSGSNPFTCSTALEFLAEPIHRTTETLELAFNRTTRQYQFSAGYYGTLFVNHSARLDISSPDLNGPSSSVTSASGTVPPFSPLAMPLSNDSHQVFMTGGYNVTPLTRATLKTSYTVAQQNENFISVTPAATFAGSPPSLKGRVDTTLAYLDVTSFEVDRLDLQANLRYEDRNDKTPEAQYLAAATTPSATLAGVTGYNKPRSWSSLKSKLEAGYMLPAEFKVLAGWELDRQERNAPERFSKVNFRTETDESSLYLEAKRSILDTLSGALGYRQSRRSGSSYRPDTYAQALPAGASGTDPKYSVNPLLWADRDRTTWKATADWVPAESWAVHAVHEESSDQYEGMALGPRNGFRMFSSIDVSYALSERWNAHFWWSRDDTRAEQATYSSGTAAAPSQLWQAKLRQLSEGLGAGLAGKTRSGIEMGLDVAFADQAAQHRMAAISGPAIQSLPDYYYRQLDLRAHFTYPLDRQSGVRADYGYQELKTDDWTWTNWSYTDGTQLIQDVSQRTHFVGASYYHRWR